MAENVAFATLTTLRLGGPARRLVTAESEAELVETVRAADAAGEPVLLIGGGSNLVVADAGFAGTTVHVATRGVTTSREGDAALVTAAAGEPWDALVARLLDDGLAGVECLAGIPGLVGAVPMQNVGAYGQDVSETIVRVRTWNRDAGRVVERDAAACHFAYRSSAFRGSDRDVILDVTFRLPASDASAPIRYAELARALGVGEGERAPARLVRSTVVELRKKKGMVLDDADPDSVSAGSFFTNPILDAAALAALRTRVGEASMPAFPEPDGRTKVSAAWLIERAGFTKGFRKGRVGISSKHALALVNRGGASTSELVDLARTIRDGVRDRFGVTLENEPVFVGVVL
ncbi:MAG TPA: UDP-N-acetylmuramate dehydrogenase [Labilithrix sp.]|jgi:UDP-N-acetylmuramate dehydrogenase